MFNAQHGTVIDLLTFWESNNKFVRAESRAGWIQKEAARTVDGTRLGASGAHGEMKPPYGLSYQDFTLRLDWAELARVLKNRDSQG